MKTAAQAASNWAASAGRAAADWQAGVQNTQADWAGNTVRQQSVMQNNWQASVANGTWAAGVQRTGNAGWKSRTIDKVSAYSLGFQTGATRQAAAAQKIQSFLQQAVPNLPPRGTFEQNKIRSTTLMDALHAQRGQLGAS